MNLAALGMALCCSATFLTALSYIVMKIGVDKAYQLGVSPYTVGTWWIGFVLTMVATIFNVASLGLVDQSALSITCALTLIFNGLLAWKILKEPLPLLKIIAVLIMCVGATIAIVFASYESNIYNALEQQVLIFSHESIVFMSTMVIFLIIGFIISEIIISTVRKEHDLEWQKSMDARDTTSSVVENIEKKPMHQHKLMYFP
jgi:glucan phosphoethanolaminetransferase (alkaline phosphatase superfamily)